MANADAEATPGTNGGAVISDCGRYRYLLSRGFTEAAPLLWVLVNPSTADAEIPDPTIDSITRISEAQGYSHFLVVNLYALRETDPKIMLRDPAREGEGKLNDQWIHAASVRAGRVIVAWGNNAEEKRASEVCELLRAHNPELYCLGTNKNGSPRHPLYMAADTPLVLWRAHERSQQPANHRHSDRDPRRRYRTRRSDQ